LFFFSAAGCANSGGGASAEGTILKFVTDSSQAVMPSVAINIANHFLLRRSQLTNDSGFRAANLTRQLPGGSIATGFLSLANRL
jgi:hypothetical protein